MLCNIRVTPLVPVHSQHSAYHLASLDHRLGHCRQAKSKGRHGNKRTEEQEDAELLQDEDTGAVTHRVTQQPSCIKHGQMRKYQIEGLNWLIHLYDNGINGILADEMVSLLDQLQDCNFPETTQYYGQTVNIKIGSVKPSMMRMGPTS